MTWNYRVMNKDGQLAVYAVYYDESGNIDGWSEKPFSPEAESLRQLRTTLNLMTKALEKEVLEYVAGPNLKSEI